MSVFLKGILPQNTTIPDLVIAMENRFGSIDVHSSRSSDNFFQITFRDKHGVRSLSVLSGDTAMHDYKIEGVLIMLGELENSKEIIQYLLDRFGGYLIDNDNNFTPIRIDLFNQASTAPVRARLVHAIIARLGYQKLNETLALFDEFAPLIEK